MERIRKIEYNSNIYGMRHTVPVNQKKQDKQTKEKRKMNKHIEEAMAIRNEQPMVCNCAQTIMRVYAKELGLSSEQAEKLGSNFGGGMKCGGTCGVITSGLLVLGGKGIESPAKIGEFRRRIAENHDGMTDCKLLLKANAERGGNKKEHCDGMIREAITLIDELVSESEK